MAESKKLLKILCIHGYRQNAKSFSEKTGSFRKIMKKYADLVYITAPHRVPPGNLGSAAWTSKPSSENGEASENTGDVESSGKSLDERGWWFTREDDYFKSTDFSNISKGFDTSVEMIIKILEDKNSQGFDGIIGFSQGACLVSILCMMQQMENKNWFKFAILFSGFKSPSSNHDKYYNQKITLPSLHVYGDSDQIIVHERSEELMSVFDNPKTLRHPGGHFVPASAPHKKVYTDFLEEMIQYGTST
uniref:Serine hydrolase domain-containing protein n=1 Tax=Arion vulgaris TaxID=1028688 RepID=A0A0B6Z5Z1_9EUPU